MLQLAVILLTAGALAAAQTKTSGTNPRPQMSMGVLALASDHEGTLYVDGERKVAVSPGRIVTLRLTAGQHFVDLRDAKGSKVWDKVVNVPSGAQVAEKIEKRLL